MQEKATDYQQLHLRPIQLKEVTHPDIYQHVHTVITHKHECATVTNDGFN